MIWVRYTTNRIMKVLHETPGAYLVLVTLVKGTGKLFYQHFIL